MLTSSRLRAVPGAHPGRKTRFYRRHRRSKIQRPRGGMHQPESTDLPRIQRETGHAVFRQLAAQGAKAICVDSWYGALQSSLAALYPIYATILTLCEVNCIETVNPGKKAGRPVVLDLQPNFDLLSQMKTLHIQFLDDQGMSLRHRDWETRLTKCRSESILRISDQSDVITVPYADTVSEQRISGTLLLGSTTRDRHRHRHGDSGLPIQGIAKAVHAVIGY